MKLRISAVLLLVCAVFMFPVMVNADNTNSKFYGKTIGEWSDDWWNWVVSYPFAESPPAVEGDVDCITGQPGGKVFFLAGHFAAPPIERFCTIPKNRVLLFPLVNAVVWAPDDCADVEDCREVVSESWLPVSPDLFCYVDDVPCVFENLMIRTQSPPFRLSSHDDWGIDVYPSIADGYWVMLPALEPGEHIIHFGANDSFGNAIQDVTYILYVH